MDEAWLKELNKKNLVLQGEDSSKWSFAIVWISSSVLAKLSHEEQEKFKLGQFKRATNEIEYWANVEEICELFGVDDPDFAGDIYTRRFNNLSSDDERRWNDLKDINEKRPEGFGVKVDWYSEK